MAVYNFRSDSRVFLLLKYQVINFGNRKSYVYSFLHFLCKYAINVKFMMSKFKISVNIMSLK